MNVGILLSDYVPIRNLTNSSRYASCHSATMLHSRDSESLAYLTLASHFLRLAEEACKQLAQSKNTSMVVSNKKITSNQIAWKTRWSDHAVGIAILFNFYHGIELVLKGCLTVCSDPPNTHALSKLLKDLEKSGLCPSVASIVATYVCQIDQASPLGLFLIANKIAIDSWFESLKYPKSKHGKPFIHTKLKYGGANTVEFWRTIGQGAAALRKQSVAFSRKTRNV